jgi:hypothetical protein
MPHPSASPRFSVILLDKIIDNLPLDEAHLEAETEAMIFSDDMGFSRRAYGDKRRTCYDYIGLVDGRRLVLASVEEMA